MSMCFRILTAGVVLVPVFAASAEPPLFPEPSIRVNGAAEWMISLDANGDGADDALVVTSDRSFEVLLGGESGLELSSTNSLEERVFDVAVGDVNGDGREDVVFLLGYVFKAVVWLADADGGFTRLFPSVPTGQDPTGLTLADMDGDGDLDFVIANNQPRSLDVRFNNGSGVTDGGILGFEIVGLDGSIHLAPLDADGDGDMDIAGAGNSTDRFRIFINDGSGALSSDVIVDFGTGDTSDLVAGDVDGDGDMDLAAPDDDNIRLYLARNDGDGTSWTLSTEFLGTDSSDSIAAGDLNQDGYDDFIVGSLGDEPAAVFYGSTDGVGDIKEISIGDFTAVPITGDFDGDGRPDLAFLNRGFDRVNMIRGGVDGRLILTGSYQTGGAFGMQDLIPVDLDGDMQDELVASMSSGDVLIYRPGTAGDLELVGEPVRVFPRGLASFDIDQDDDMDLVFSTTGFTSGIGWVLNQGDGTFGGPTYRASEARSSGIALLDYDDDADQDVLVSGGGILRVFPNLGGGLFGKEITMPSAEPNEALHLIDVNNDGLDDAICTSETQQPGVIVQLGLDQGVYAPPVRWLTGLQPGDGLPSAIASADFDADGALDLVVACQDATTILLNDGVGGFPSLLRPQPYGDFESVDVADFNGDGEMDIAAVFADTQEVVVFLRRPAGFTFEARTYGTDAQPRVVRAIDVNGDGRPDLVVGGQRAVVNVLINQSEPVCEADLSPPFGVLDFDDVLAFLVGFSAMDPVADLAPPFGVVNFDDILAFLTAFGAGCP